MIYEIAKKRKHVYEYRTDNIPDIKLVKDLLYKTWEVTPSKQNIMPYRVSVVGPENSDTKQKIYDKVVGNHRRMEDEGEKAGYIEKASNKINPHYRHVLHNPYLIVFSQRVCTDRDVNPFYARQIEKGHFMEQTCEKYVKRIKGSTAIEVGLFAQNFASFCLEENIDYSFTVCFPGDKEDWENIPFVEQPVVLLMSIGKAKTYRRDYLTQRASDQDYKTAFGNVVHFV